MPTQPVTISLGLVPTVSSSKAITISSNGNVAVTADISVGSITTTSRELIGDGVDVGVINPDMTLTKISWSEVLKGDIIYYSAKKISELSPIEVGDIKATNAGPNGLSCTSCGGCDAGCPTQYNCNTCNALRADQSCCGGNDSLPPTITTNSANNISSGYATLNGKGRPGGSPTIGWFRISDVNPGICNDGFGTRVPSTGGADLGNGGAEKTYSYNVSGMTGSTTYHYCAIGVNASGTGLGSVISFTTRALIPPTVTTGSSSDICSNSAYTSGSANPKGSYTNVWFRYSADPSFVCNDMSGTKTSSSDVGFGDTNTSFKTQISGLSSNTNYYYCAIAQNEGGQKAIGGTMTFKTNTKSCGGGGGRGEQQNNFDAAPPTSTPFSTGGGGTL